MVHWMEAGNNIYCPYSISCPYSTLVIHYMGIIFGFIGNLRGIIIWAGILSLSFRGIIGHFRGIIICAVIFFLKFPRYYHMSRYPLFKLPWYYRTLPRYYHMCRYLLSYASAVLSHVPISSLFGFRSNSPLCGIRLVEKRQILIVH